MNVPYTCAILIILAAPVASQDVREIEEVVSTQSAGVAPVLLRGPVALGAIALGGLPSGGGASGQSALAQGSTPQEPAAQGSTAQPSQSAVNLGGLSNSSGPGSTFASVILGGGGAANGTTGTTTSTTRTVK